MIPEQQLENDSSENALKILENYLHEDLDQETQDHLAELAKGNPELRQDVAALLVQHEVLAEYFRQEKANDEEAFVGATLTALDLSLRESSETAAVQIMKSIGNLEPVAKKTAGRQDLKRKQHISKSFAQTYLRESSQANWGFRFVAALAATVLIVAGGYWLVNHNGAQPQRVLVASNSALASVETASGTVEINRAGSTIRVQVGTQVVADDVVVVSPGGRAGVKYENEQTTVNLLAGTRAKLWLDNGAKRVSLDTGTLVCKIDKQPQSKAMRFVTPHAHAVVLGTELKLQVTNDATRLEVTEGSVTLVKNEQNSVTVRAGEFAVASENDSLKSQSLATESPVQVPGNANGQTAANSGYYQRWPNGLPSDPNFFPIWVWDQSPLNAKDYKEIGINLFVRPCGVKDADLAMLRAAGMKVICEQDDEDLKFVSDKTIVGWFNYDQPDITQVAGDWRRAAMDPSAVNQQYKTITARDKTRPVYMAFSQGIVRDDYPPRGARMNHPADYREYAQAADILSLHVMPVNEPQPPVRNNPWYVAKATDNLRASCGNTKPVWCAIECTKLSPDSPAKPTPAQVKAEVWMALVHGAKGIGYLCFSRDQSFEMGALLKDKAMLATVAEINRQITSLAPVLNSATVGDGATVSSSNTAVPVDLMVKNHAGTTYIFAVAMRDGSTTATFTSPSGSNVEVLGENRSLAINNGKFSDQFESYGVHLYKVSGSAQTASK
jgi:hypothetical protein